VQGEGRDWAVSLRGGDAAGETALSGKGRVKCFFGMFSGQGSGQVSEG
jgi:hypothetical protein